MQVDQHKFHGLTHSAELIEAELRRRMAPLGIQHRQARVLEAIERLGPVSQSDLAKAFGITPASMSTMTERLLAAGHITRSVDPASRRQNVLDLTDQGRQLISGIAEVWTSIDATVRAILGDQADDFFAQSLALRRGLGGTIPGTKPDEPHT